MNLSSSPRYLAWSILNQVELKQGWAQGLLDASKEINLLPDVDKRLCRELVLGIIRNKTWLDYQVQALLSKPKLPKLKQLNLLRLGIYQLLCLDKIPEHAAVDETVKIAKQRLSLPFGGFVNAILRRLIREGEQPLPDKDADPIKYCQLAYSFPKFVCQQWLTQFGLNHATTMMEIANQPPSLVVRTNVLRITRDVLMEKFKGSDIQCQPGLLATSIIIDQTIADPSNWPEFKSGGFYFQDTASQMIGLIAAPKPGETWLDLCAAPGGKTTHLAELMNNQGTVWAYDISNTKRELIKENRARLGLSCIEVIDQLEQINDVDGVLVDAPCSGLGTLRRHVETKWRITEREIEQLAQKQFSLLAQAAQKVKIGGKLIYATCTTTWQENDQVVQKFSDQHRDFIVQDQAMLYNELEGEFWDNQHQFKTYPHHPTLDGMFAVVWKKVS